MNWLKDNLHLFVGALLIIVLVTVLGNAIREGYTVLVTQERIDDTYRIHR